MRIFQFLVPVNDESLFTAICCSYSKAEEVFGLFGVFVSFCFNLFLIFATNKRMKMTKRRMPEACLKTMHGILRLVLYPFWHRMAPAIV